MQWNPALWLPHQWKTHKFSYRKFLLKYSHAVDTLMPHSNILACIICDNFTPFMQPLVSVVFVFPLLIIIVCELLEVSIFFKSAFTMFISEQLFRSAIVIISMKTSLNLYQTWNLTLATVLYGQIFMAC